MIPEPAGDIPATQRVPQFRLRTLFLLIAVLAVLFAVMGTIGPIASAALLLFLCMAGLHVAGNALGTTLRDDSSARFRWQNATAIESESKPAANRSTMTAPRLSEHTPLGWIRYAIFFIGALVGGALGGLAFGQLTNSPAQLAVGVLSFAVLGAFFGFLGGSFLAILLRAWNQAAREPLKADIEAG